MALRKRGKAEFGLLPRISAIVELSISSFMTIKET